MVESPLTLQQAIEILEITDIGQMNNGDFSKLRRKAQRRWHPDRIFHANPDPAKVTRYQENFRRIDEAIEVIRAYLAGETHVSEAIREDYQAHRESPPPEEPEDVIRRNAAAMQETLREVWSRVKETGYKLYEEVVTVSAGVRYADLLKMDIFDDMPVLAVLSAITTFWATIILALVIILVSMIILAVSRVGIVVGALANIVLLMWFVQALACLVAALPLARFWLPDPVGEAVLFLVNLGLSILKAINNLGLHNIPFFGIFLGFAIGLPTLAAKVVKWVVLFPLYLVVGALLGDRAMGRITQTVKYYAGGAEWYVDELLVKDPGAMTSEDLFSLSGLYTELKDVPRI